MPRCRGAPWRAAAPGPRPGPCRAGWHTRPRRWSTATPPLRRARRGRHAARGGGVAVAPDLLEQRLAGEDVPGAPGKGHEQVEFQRRQRQRLPVAPDEVPGDIDVEVTDAELLAAGFVAAAQPGAYPGHQLGRL